MIYAQSYSSKTNGIIHTVVQLYDSYVIITTSV